MGIWGVVILSAPEVEQLLCLLFQINESLGLLELQNLFLEPLFQRLDDISLQ